ncbi:hypothetical protein GTP77_20825 [Massilia sp. FT127W]|uniref:Cysteinyl-tRNA synthetase n=1 Tax=Pseudoduganella aquatica TaxID=2660641 RepID=A0A7X4HGJ9_9BURK|nr:hypothetical protein [Pseudoduganella aquatica]
MEQSITEGALTFDFPPGAKSSKYDDWSHYRNQFQNTCGASKAVDIVVKENNALWLIEVKDFRQHARTKAIDLADEIAVKVRDTLAGLVSAQCHAVNTDEQRMAKELLKSRKLRVVCHLEQPAKHSRLRPRAFEPDKLELKLRTLLKAIDPHPAVVDKNSLHDTMNWTVR